MYKQSPNRFLLLYASQTGQAKAIAEEIFQQATDRGLEPDLHCLSLVDKRFSLEKEHCVALLSSTTGDGDPPDTALKFMRRINKKTLASDLLSKMNYTVLGLGDTNYSNFCNNAKNIDRRLKELGATHFYPSGFADEAVGLEIVVDPWIEGLFSAVKTCLQNRSNCAASDLTADLPASPSLKNGSHSTESDAGDGSQHLTTDKIQDKSECSDLDFSQNPGVKGSDSSLSSKDNAESMGSVQTQQTNSITDSLQTQTADVTQVLVVNEFSSSVTPDTNHISNVTISGDTTVGTKTDLEVTQSEVPHDNLLMLSKPSSDAPSLKLSLPPLSESGLTLPAATPAFLVASFGAPDQDLQKKLAELPWQNGCKPPSAASDIVKAKIVSAQRLTTEDALKKTLLLRLNIENTGLKYRPGDAISIICANDDKEVEQLITRLNLTQMADAPLCLKVMPDTKKRRAAVPPHVPEEGASLRYILKNCLDIREPPKKAMLRLLVEYTSDDSEKRRLQELCSKEGAEDYTAFVRAENVSLLDVLYTFPSCRPPVERLLENLPRLQPRPYSTCSCEEWRPGHLDIAFNVVDIPTSSCRLYPRQGLCTGWLDDITEHLQLDGKRNKEDGGSIADVLSQVGSVTLEDLEIRVFSRTNQHFHSPSNLSTPLIMIGPGTGVAPYIGFLQERQLLLEKEGKDNVGESWLLFGCRHEKKDFLFREEMQAFQTNRVLSKFLPSFSRDTPDRADNPRYVQDNLRAHSSQVYSLIHEKDAVVYVCGDAKNMAKDVSAALEKIMITEQGISEDDAKAYIMKMRIHKHYLEDVWT